jgi:hypothetical protein
MNMKQAIFGKMYKGGQFMPGGGRAAAGGERAGGLIGNIKEKFHLRYIFWPIWPILKVYFYFIVEFTTLPPLPPVFKSPYDTTPFQRILYKFEW